MTVSEFDTLLDQLSEHYRTNGKGDNTFIYWLPDEIEQELPRFFAGYEDRLAPYIGAVPVDQRGDDVHFDLELTVRNAAHAAGVFVFGSVVDGTSATFTDPEWERLYHAAWALRLYQDSRQEREKFDRRVNTEPRPGWAGKTHEEALEGWRRLRAPREPMD
jgi:hypothetical protein